MADATMAVEKALRRYGYDVTDTARRMVRTGEEPHDKIHEWAIEDLEAATPAAIDGYWAHVERPDPEEQVEAGFDLTKFFGRDPFRELINRFSLVGRFEERLRNGEPTGKGRWVWEGEGLKIVTACNPLTGEHGSANRKREPAYASYIGIEGKREKVREAYNFIAQNARWKDAVWGNRDYI